MCTARLLSTIIATCKRTIFSPDGRAVPVPQKRDGEGAKGLQPGTARCKMRESCAWQLSPDRCSSCSLSGQGGEDQIDQFGIGSRAAADAEGVRVLYYDEFLAGEYHGVVAASAPGVEGVARKVWPDFTF